MKKCTKIVLSLSLLICGDAFAMNKKGRKQQTPPPAVTSSTPHAQWPSPAESASKASKEAAEAKKAADCKTKFNGVVNAIKDVNVAHAEARVLNHPQAFRTQVVPTIVPAARASLKAVPAQVTVAQTTASTTDESWTIANQPAITDAVELAAVNTDIAIDMSGAPTEASVVVPASDEVLPGYSSEHIQALKDKIAAATTKMAAQQEATTATSAESTPATVDTAPEAATVTTEVVTAAPAVEATTAAPVAAVAAVKPSYITAMMKIACVRSTNLAKALYFLQNTANRDDLTRKEIGSRLGDAIPETIAALKQIHSLCYGKSEIQSSDEITRLQEPLVRDLEAALNLAILPAEGEKQIQVDTSMLKMAVKELQKLNTHQKHQATRVVQAATAHAHKNKALAFLVKANMESRGDNSLDGELSDDEYNGTLDMLNIVAAETQEAADKE